MNPFGENSKSACPASDRGRENPGKDKATKVLGLFSFLFPLTTAKFCLLW